MEIINVPLVSLVNANCHNIGYCSDDPGWWQALEEKFQHDYVVGKNIKKSKTSELDFNKTPSETTHNCISMSEKHENSTSKTKLTIEDTDSVQELTMEPIETIKYFQKKEYFDQEEINQCNVIGETPLHIAIMYIDFETLKYLIDRKGFDVNLRGIHGKFVGGFNSKETSKLISESKYESLAYYGEYPLALAACFANKKIYDYLIEKGADPNLQGFIIF